ncbi:hypothetical protein MSAR_07680 [Mycolicibacterium sarraceniae]|uniref:Uncharacterized protein n=1 Tax=Mycolicibacterium sarraceniae TaxID=1534348 RepID=A0A7I7SL10_9MYCO|nr:hypothetical protein MSAR_07680 [Mycolicibacterium sarraceniae]
MLTVAAQLSHTVDAVRTVGDRSRQIGEHLTRGVHPPAAVGIGGHRGDLQGQAREIGELTQQAHPSMRHDTLAVSRHFHP